MKKRFLDLFLLLLSITTLIPVFSQASDFILRINGHNHRMQQDLVYRSVQEWYKEMIEDSSMIRMADSLARSYDLSLDTFYFPANANFCYLIDSTGYYDFAVKITMDSVSLIASGYECLFHVDIRDMGWIFYGSGAFMNGRYRILQQKIKVLLPPISIGHDSGSQCQIIADYLQLSIADAVEQQLDAVAEHFRARFIEEAFLALNPVASLGIGDSSLVAQALQAFPLEIEIYTEYDHLESKINFVEEVRFLTGTPENPDVFIGIQPREAAGNSLHRAGFSFLYWGLQRGFPWRPNWDQKKRVAKTFDVMKTYKIRDYRIEAGWRQLQSRFHRGDDLDPADLSPQEMNIVPENHEYLNPEAYKTLDAILEEGCSQGLSPFMAVGVGHQDALPLDASGLAIAPATSGWTALPGFVAVRENEYLYNLKLYAHATVKYFADRIDVWQIENELNAADWAARVPGWWREGDLWLDEAFRDKVWHILVEAVRLQDPTALIVHDFHMLGFMASLQKWITDVDIVGINFYPNYAIALPVMGFMVGEYVWAVRRALAGLGYPEKPVWVVETGYPAIDRHLPQEKLPLSADMYTFTEERQRMYVEEALSSCATYGAAAFFYFTLTTPQEESPDHRALNRYMLFCGLIRHEDDNAKLALQRFAELSGNMTENTAVYNAPKSVSPSFKLLQNFPNPFNNGTTIQYSLYTETLVRINIYTLRGRRIAKLEPGFQPPGDHQLYWDAAGFPSGVYFYQIQLNDRVRGGKKLILLR
ncbi:T9SS type A sorting domain-containing protein [candidate division KSB1 bacterium]|nr:T9SS type A sorting domain-containing protein [candidate division KSB1 bacterium]